MIYEFCAENVTLLEKAMQAGARRIELCDNLAVGGTTPSYGVTKAAVELAANYDTTIMTMIRPRGGDFVYNDLEIAIMLEDIRLTAQAGSQGVVLPLLPTTPFLLLSIACFSRSSKRFEDWLYHTKLYQAYVADFRETKSIARERKKKIIVSIYILMGISIYFAPLLPVKIGLGALTIFITYYLFKVIPDKE